MEKKVNASIVLYNSDFVEINRLICLLHSAECVNRIYLVDNSPKKNVLFETCDADYFFLGKNIGYGSGHNLAIQESFKSGFKYHLVLNSDISFDKAIVYKLLQKIDEDSDIGLLMPKILNTDGSIQFLPKLLPSPFNLLIRVLPVLQKLFKSKNEEYILRNNADHELNVPVISGCFCLFRLEVLESVGLYDEKFFMYFEDLDMSRRIHSRYKTIYFPSVCIIHEHKRGAAKKIQLFMVFVKSAILYFNKYGWLLDNERTQINKNVIKNISVR